MQERHLTMPILIGKIISRHINLVMSEKISVGQRTVQPDKVILKALSNE